MNQTRAPECINHPSTSNFVAHRYQRLIDDRELPRALSVVSMRQAFEVVCLGGGVTGEAIARDFTTVVSRRPLSTCYVTRCSAVDSGVSSRVLWMARNLED